jgi:allose kinase
MSSYVGIDIGGTNTRILTMNDRNEFILRENVSTRTWADLPSPLDALADLILSHFSQLNERPDGVMLGLPGTLSRDRKKVYSLPFIQSLDNCSVADILADKIDCRVLMDKDVNHLHLWDLHALSSMPYASVGLYLGTGMGNSLWINGDFYHGAHGSSGEIGHIPWLENELPCPCGKSGCAETLTSGSWLAMWAQQHNIQQGELGDLFVYHSEHPDIQKFIERLGMIIASEMNILDPEMLILGGGVIGMHNFPRERLVSYIRRHLRGPQPANSLTISFSLQTGDTGCQGACIAAKRFFQ